MFQDTFANNNPQSIPSQDPFPTDSEIVLLSRDKYEAFSDVMSKTYSLLDTICSEKEFRDYMSGINNGPSSVAEKEGLMFGMRCFLVKDVVYIYEKLGHLVDN